MSERTKGTGERATFGSRMRASVERRPRRAVLGVTTGLAALTMLLVVLAPVSSAAMTSPNALRTFVAPYSGTGNGAGTFSLSGCGIGSGIASFPTFNTTNGKGGASGSISDKGCKTANSTGFTDLLFGILGAAPFTTTTGKHTVTVFWTINATITLKVKTGGTTPIASASTIMIGEALLDDNTNSTSIASTFTWIQSNSTFLTGTITWHHTFVLKFPIVGTLVAGHKYSVESTIFVYTSASANTGANSASAAVNMASGGNGAKLTKITVL